ncbi:MAG: C69 family dipeptidase [Bacteroidales bacterium]|jgi:dipeptidase|nr:C69 family dipeptidase [Bacteroidales bacterium]
MIRNFLFAALLLFVMSGNSQRIYNQMNDPYFGESCTSILVGKKASTDGSVITSHTCDGRYRTWLQMEKAQTFENDTTDKIYKYRLKTETPWDMRGVEVAGEIPQAEHVYAYLNTAYPCLNEKQLAMGETTIVGHEELVNEDAWFHVEELQRLALQRCTTARQAIQLIADLIDKYGYGDWGECITIADKNEIWQMEIFGEGPKKVGGVWAAQRIPDDHVGVSANISRIGTLDLDNPDYFMASKNVKKVAKKLDLWDGESEFKFWKAYGTVEKPFKIREYFILDALAPSLKLDYEADELPFSLKPDEKVSVHDVIALYRETYEGTEYDMTQNLLVAKKKYDEETGEEIGVDTVKSEIAQPWPMRNERNIYNALAEETVEFQRTVAVSWCSYSHIIQLRDWLPDEIGGLVWFSFDNPAQSPRIPIFAGTTELPESFAYCGQKRYREDATIWDYRKANKLATLQWQSTRDGMIEEVSYFEEKATRETAEIEKQVNELLEKGEKEAAQELLNDFTRDFTGQTKYRWKQLEDEYWQRFGLGF